MSKLVVIFGGKESESDLKDDRVTTVGRSSRCGLTIKDTALSREHCEFRKSGDGFVVADKGSRNGTLVNGKRITETPLHAGDKIAIGNVVIYFERKPEKPQQASQDTDERRERLPHVLNDYAVAGAPAGFSFAAKIVIAAVLAVVAAAGGLFLLSSLKSDRQQASGPINLVHENPSFEQIAVGEIPKGWKLSSDSKSWIRADKNIAKEGGHSLAIEKQPSPRDFEVACVNGGKIDLKDYSSLDASVWVKGGQVEGIAGIKIEWFEAGKKSPLFEEYATARLTADWFRVNEKFNVPSRAAHALLSLVVAGRSGAIHFDDVVITGNRGGERAKEISIGIYNVALSRNGVVSIYRKGQKIVSDCRLQLAARDGRSPSTYRKAEASVNPPRVSINTQIDNPVNLEPVNCALDLRYLDGDLTLTYSIPRESLLQIDRLELVGTIPQTADLVVVNGKGNIPTRLSYTAGNCSIVLEYFDIMEVGQSKGEEQVELISAIDVPRVGGDGSAGGRGNEVTVGFTVGESILNRASEVKAELEKAHAAMTARRYGEAATLYEKLRRVANDTAILKEIEDRLNGIKAIEKEERTVIELMTVEAQLSLLDEKISALKKTIKQYCEEFKGTAYAESLAENDAQLDDILNDLKAEGEEDRAAVLLRYAKEFYDAGMPEFAVSAIEALMNHYPGSSAAQEAEDVLKGDRKGGNGN